MADAYPVVGWVEKVPLFSAEWVPSVGTETLDSVKVRLRDSQGTIIAAVDDIDATGFTSGASAAPEAWYDFDPIALGLTEPTMASGQSTYTLRYKATDSNGKRYRSTICIILKPDGS